MPSAVQVLLVCLFGGAYAQHRNQLTQATQPGVNQRGYPAAPAPQAGEYDTYASLFQNAAPYSPGYSALVQYNNQPFGAGQHASGIIAAGPYGYPPDTSGRYRQMNYGDAVRGFRANLPTFGANQPGAAPGVSNIAAFNAAPIPQPVPTGSAQEAAAAAYGPRAAAPNAVGYGGFGPSTSDPYALAARAFESAQYGRYGYGSSEAAPGGPLYGRLSRFDQASYAAGYNSGVNALLGGYGGRPFAYQQYRSR